VLTLTIPAPCKPLNSNDRLHWQVKRKRTAAWRARAHVAAIQAGRPKLDRAHVTATIHPLTRRKFDAGNFYPTVKACIDGIVGDTGLLPDDDNAHLVGPDIDPGDKAEAFTVVLVIDPECGCRRCEARFGEAA
jgi:hypothetical protein